MKSKIYFLVAIIFLFAAVAAIAFLGSFTRMHADDFCIAADARQMDLISFFTKWYQGWTGRFVYIPTAGLLSLGGPPWASLLPPLTIGFWFISVLWAAWPAFRHLRASRPGTLNIAFAGLFLLVLLSSIPNLFQSVFWKDGLINYTFPLIGMTLSIGLMLRGLLGANQHGVTTIMLLFLLSFTSGGFSEIYSTTQIVVYLTLLISVFIFKSSPLKRMLPAFAAGLVGSLCAYGIVLAAPGNQVRQGIISAHPNLVSLVTFSLRSTIVIVAKYFAHTPVWALLSILVPFLAGYALIEPAPSEPTDQPLRWSWLREEAWFQAGLSLPILAFIFTWAACAPVVYMLNAYPDDRSIIIPLYFIVGATIISSLLWGYGLRQIGWQPKNRQNIHPHLLSPIIISLLLIGGTLFSITQSAQQFASFQDYAARWDQRHAQLVQISQQGLQEATVFGLENRFGISDLRAEPDYWVNRCMADYYGLAAIYGK